MSSAGSQRSGFGHGAHRIQKPYAEEFFRCISEEMERMLQRMCEHNTEKPEEEVNLVGKQAFTAK